MPRDTEDILSERTNYPDGRKEGVMNDPTGVQIGITTGQRGNVLGKQRNPYSINDQQKEPGSSQYEGNRKDKDK